MSRKEKFSIIAGGLSEARQGFKALPGVKQKIEQIAKSLNPDSVMLNQEFTSERVSKRISPKFFDTEFCPPDPPSEQSLAWGEQESICF
ncbi:MULTISPECIES: hypothetical protein [Moorena]|uniref:Uncharacterized protein n=1 Tax=Moorena producens 3L TaxID=489825 RepID=F4XIR3_9CYAN|nr:MULTISPECIES: hypothetical protein [Moorena]NES86255.1 hypothetical protein [Moorena sp. SIO2B7]EGJ35575.1 hypothetical protein LYNGBM3L_02930 [Moorena producens 3L]NEP32790.1 hypothetical protein [Moorena sp. SIO3B2]NEP69113.1 hypothetical protein [Moorena sp. SIO3A5]NEQ06037.1 hypothetical protein [Moorena sp. SIO4E2]